MDYIELKGERKMNSIYQVAHLCGCGEVYSHSQADCDEHRGHDCINVPTPFNDWMGALREKWLHNEQQRREDRERLLKAVLAYFKDCRRGRARIVGTRNERRIVFQVKDRPTCSVWFPIEGRVRDIDVVDLINTIKWVTQ